MVDALNGAADVEKSVIAPSYLKFAQELSSKRKQIREKCALNCEACQDDKGCCGGKQHY